MRTSASSAAVLRALKRGTLTGLFGLLALPAFGQSLQQEVFDVDVGPTQLMTTDSNPGYGWFELGDGRLGILGLEANTDGVQVTTSAVKLRLGGKDWLLSGAAQYRLNPPSGKPTMEATLADPALCQDYGAPPPDPDPRNWIFRVLDASNNALLNPIREGTQAQYVLNGLVLVPEGQAKVRCYSGMATNGSLISLDRLFADGAEDALPDVEVAFYKNNDPLSDIDRISALSQGVGSNSTIIARVKNVGASTAKDVVVREAWIGMQGGIPAGICQTRVGVGVGVPGNWTTCETTKVDFSIGDLAVNAYRDYRIARAVSGVAGSNALLQVAAFSNPDSVSGLNDPTCPNSACPPESNLSNNSRTLVVTVVNEIKITLQTNVEGGSASHAEILNTSIQGCARSAGSNEVICDPQASGTMTFTAKLVGAGIGDYTFMGFGGCDAPQGQPLPPTDTGSYGYDVGSGGCTLTANFKKKPTISYDNGSVYGTVDLDPAGGKVHVGGTVTLSVSNLTSGKKVDKVEGFSIGGGAACPNITRQAGLDAWDIANVQASCGVKVFYVDKKVTVNTNLIGDVGDSTIDPVIMEEKPWGTYGYFFEVSLGSARRVVSATDDCGPGGAAGVFNQPSNEYKFLSSGGGLKPASGETCTVTIEFAKVTWTVTGTSSPLNGGSISFDNGGLVDDGSRINFTVSSSPTYHLVATPGVSGGSHCGNVQPEVGGGWSVGPIEGAGCEVSAEFSNLHEIKVKISSQTQNQGQLSCYTGSAPHSGTCVKINDELTISNIIYGERALFLAAPDDSADVVVVENPSGTPGCFGFYSAGTTQGVSTMSSPAAGVTNDCLLEIKFETPILRPGRSASVGG